MIINIVLFLFMWRAFNQTLNRKEKMGDKIDILLLTHNTKCLIAENWNIISACFSHVKKMSGE